ncbi:heme-binding protein [Halovivax gelatinilyticus]|uniref:heme-binding protein n=1 Tax=Halovivax gelatinilyticus TaxID=2961597 RepID=UPI0020CA3661|nr:heme-binding protein [Halovivax gelatinilyticus]
MDRREPPETAEGWYVLHDVRSIDWDAWREAPSSRRERAIETGIEYLTAAERVDDADDGASTTVSLLGHEGDLLVVHLRPTIDDLDALSRRFERTEFAAFTERTDSYLSVTEASGYGGARGYFEDDGEVDAGMKRYIESRLYPDIPDADYVSFYPMDKRRDPEYNWYDLPFDERAEYMSGHGEIGKSYAGRVSQIISGSVGFDDHEWGVTLFADDPVDIKDLIYEMRFDPSSSRFADFGRFLFGRRFDPANLGAFLAGESLTGDGGHHGEGGHPHGAGGHHGSSDHPHGSADSHSHGAGSHHGGSGHGDGAATGDGDEVRSELSDLGVYAGKPHGEDVHAVVLYSAADPGELFEEVDGLRTNFDHYDTHVKTAVYRPSETQSGSESRTGADREPSDVSDDAEAAVVSLWETESAAETAAGFLAELPDVVRQAGDDEDDSWGTMGMFYTVKSDHRSDFVATFAEVGDVLEGMDGHRKTDLLENRENENDMFIASRWDTREDAMAFFRSDAFADTVEYGRDVLAERPRHVFLA